MSSYLRPVRAAEARLLARRGRRGEWECNVGREAFAEVRRLRCGCSAKHPRFRIPAGPGMGASRSITDDARMSSYLRPVRAAKLGFWRAAGEGGMGVQRRSRGLRGGEAFAVRMQCEASTISNPSRARHGRSKRHHGWCRMSSYLRPVRAAKLGFWRAAGEGEWECNVGREAFAEVRRLRCGCIASTHDSNLSRARHGRSTQHHG